MNKIKVALLGGALLLSQFGRAAPKEYAPQNTAIQFTAIGKPAMLKIKGKSADLKGKITIDTDQLTANLQLNLDSLVTGIETRDSHMKEKYLESSKYPTADLNIQQLKLPTPFENLKSTSAVEPFHGELLLHGIKQKVQGTYQVEEVTGAKVRILAKYSVNLSDFKIDVPTYIGIKVADTVEVESQFELQK